MSLGPEDLRVLPWGSDAILMLGTGEGPLPHVRGGHCPGGGRVAPGALGPAEPWSRAWCPWSLPQAV